MAPVYDKNDIQIHEISYEEGGLLWKLQRDGFTRYFIYNREQNVYVESECRQPEVTLSTD